MTLAGYVNLIYRANFMPEDTAALFVKRAPGYSFESLQCLFHESHVMNKHVRHGKSSGRRIPNKQVQSMGMSKISNWSSNTMAGKRMLRFLQYFNRVLFLIQFSHRHPDCCDLNARNHEEILFRGLYLKTQRKKRFVLDKGYTKKKFGVASGIKHAKSLK